MRVAVYIASQQKGFLLSTARLLARDHDVCVVAYDANVAALVGRLAPEFAESMVVQSEVVFPVQQDKAVAEALRMEGDYGIRMSFVMGKDRGLGRGYIFNADCYPDVGRSWWSHERKLAELVSRFLFAEHVLDTLRPDVIIGLQKVTELYCVARARGVRYYSPAAVKFGSRYIVSDDEYLTNSKYRENIKALALSGEQGDEELGGYEQEAGSKYNHGKLSYTWRRTLFDVGRQCWGEVKKILRGRMRKDSYAPFGWVPSILRSKLAYDYFCKHGKTPDELKGYQLVYVPLHLEPEIALLSVSPEFNNTMEMVAWVSKSLPANALLVVKEQPYAFGIRSQKYYDMLRRIGNVVLAHPDTKSWPWIEASGLVVAITGTAGTEAVNMHRPVLSYGAHQVINHLPTVRFARDYSTTRDAVDALLAIDKDHPDFSRAKWCLRKAQIDNSFELKGYERTFGGLDSEPELAQCFVAALYAYDPTLGGAGQ